MGNITWTKSWSASDNGTVFGGADLQNIQGDITTVINGGITNSNVNASAAIAESKIAFDTTSGHDHDGSNSKSVAATAKHFRKGLILSGDDDTNVVVSPGTADIGGTLISKATASGDLAIATGTNWVHGSATVSSWCYVYIYNNSGAIGYKFSDEAPDLSDEDDAVVETPFRYQLYGGVYYRCIGCVFIDADGDLCWGQTSSEGMYVSNFDASNVCIINGLGTGADQTMNTLWTPKYINVILGEVDTTPATNDSIKQYEVTQKMLSFWQNGSNLPVQLNAGTNIDNAFPAVRWIAPTGEGSVNAITAQIAGTSGSFTIDTMLDGEYWYAMVWTDEV